MHSVCGVNIHIWTTVMSASDSRVATGEKLTDHLNVKNQKWSLKGALHSLAEGILRD